MEASFSLKASSVPEVSGGLVLDKVPGGYNILRTQQARSSVGATPPAWGLFWFAQA